MRCEMRCVWFLGEAALTCPSSIQVQVSSGLLHKRAAGRSVVSLILNPWEKVDTSQSASEEREKGLTRGTHHQLPGDFWWQIVVPPWVKWSQFLHFLSSDIPLVITLHFILLWKLNWLLKLTTAGVFRAVSHSSSCFVDKVELHACHFGGTLSEEVDCWHSGGYVPYYVDTTSAAGSYVNIAAMLFRARLPLYSHLFTGGKRI